MGFKEFKGMNMKLKTKNYHNRYTCLENPHYFTAISSKLQCHKTSDCYDKISFSSNKKRPQSVKRRLLMRNLWEKKAIAEQDNEEMKL
jgi:hypothetical protein